MVRSQPFGWYIIVICGVIIAHKWYSDNHTSKVYNRASLVTKYVKEIDKQLRPHIFRADLFADISEKYRVQVEHTRLGYICTLDSSTLHLLDNFICMMHAHNTIHRVLFLTMDSETDLYMHSKYPLLLRNYVDLEGRVASLPLASEEKTLVKKQLKRIVTLKTVSLFAKKEFDVLVTNPYTFWTKNMTLVHLRPAIYVPYDLLLNMMFYGQMGNTAESFPINKNLMTAESFVLMGKKETGRWIDGVIDRLASTFTSLQGAITLHCEDPRAKCRPLRHDFLSTTDWFHGTRHEVPVLIEMDRAEYRTPEAIDKIGANFLTTDGKCNMTKAWEFGTSLLSAPALPSEFPNDRLVFVSSTNSESKLHSTSNKRRRYAHHSIIDTII